MTDKQNTPTNNQSRQNFPQQNDQSVNPGQGRRNPSYTDEDEIPGRDGQPQPKMNVQDQQNSRTNNPDNRNSDSQQKQNQQEKKNTQQERHPQHSGTFDQ